MRNFDCNIQKQRKREYGDYIGVVGRDWEGEVVACFESRSQKKTRVHGLEYLRRVMRDTTHRLNWHSASDYKVYAYIVKHNYI
jgi:hypothetical protein